MKWAHKVKILRVFESCETYIQWNNAFDWFSDTLRHKMSLWEYGMLHEAIFKIFEKQKLTYTHDKIPGIKKFDN